MVIYTRRTPKRRTYSYPLSLFEDPEKLKRLIFAKRLWFSTKTDISAFRRLLNNWKKWAERKPWQQGWWFYIQRAPKKRTYAVSPPPFEDLQKLRILIFAKRSWFWIENDMSSFRTILSNGKRWLEGNLGQQGWSFYIWRAPEERTSRSNKPVLKMQRISKYEYLLRGCDFRHGRHLGKFWVIEKIFAKEIMYWSAKELIPSKLQEKRNICCLWNSF